MAASDFYVYYPEGEPDWSMALRRIECLNQEQILSAVSELLRQWGDESTEMEEVHDLSARHFLLGEMDTFTQAYQSLDESKGIGFQPIPEGYDGYRDPLRSATVILSLLGVLQAAGFRVEADFAPFDVWPEGEQDPAFSLPAPA